MASAPINPLEMSDEDFLKMNGPAPVDAVEEEPAEEEEAQTGAEEDSAEEDDDTALNEGADEEDEGNGEDTEAEESTETDETSEDNTSGEDGEGEAKAKPKAAEQEEKPTKAEAKPAEVPDYEAAYKQIMAPFKANGKTFTPQSVGEVIQLAQMGANYTKKLQDIQPHRKMLLMLQNNDLLDEGKLSYLIDLDKKNPEAIKKLIKDAGIDPMDIDTESETDYTGSNHSVTEEESRFHEVLEEVSSTDIGRETVGLINETWDDASKEVIWAQPEVMSVIHQQRENGIYAIITAEMDRQKTLGKIPASTPFLQAYKAVGDVLAQAGAFASAASENGNPEKPEPRKIGERAAKPKPKAANGEQAKAASTMRGSSNPTKPPLVNPLAMSDEEFLKLDNLKQRL